MATNIEQTANINAENISNGHNIHYSFSVRSLAITESWPLMLDCNISCPVLSTSWKLGITYQQIPETGKVSCFVTFSRTNLTNTSVEANVLISILDENNRFVRYPRSICTSQMLTNETIQGLFEDFRDPGYRSFILSLEFVLRISILIRSCHFTEDFDRQRYFSSNVTDMHYSKK